MFQTTNQKVSGIIPDGLQLENWFQHRPVNHDLFRWENFPMEKTHGFIKQTHFPKQSMEQTSGDLSNSPARSHPRVGTWPGLSPLKKLL